MAKTYRDIWHKFMCMTKDQQLAEMKRLGSSDDTIESASKFWSKEGRADHIVWLTENLTPRQRELVDTYIDQTDAIVSFSDGKWNIQDPCESWNFDDKMEMLSVISDTLEQIWLKEKPKSCNGTPSVFYLYHSQRDGFNYMVREPLNPYLMWSDYLLFDSAEECEEYWRATGISVDRWCI